MRVAIGLAGLLALACALPARAQEAPAAPVNSEAATPSVFDGDYLTVAVGGGYGPTYEGSDNYHAFVLPLVQARWHGIQVSPRAGGVGLDFVPGPLNLGVVGNLRFNRTGKTHDPVVDSLGKLKTAVEVGPTAGVTMSKLLDPYDSLSFNVDATWDVGGAYKGMTVHPSVSYVTPLSRALLASLSASAEYGDRKFVNYYYRITPAQSATSGLPVYNPGSGFTKVGANMLLGIDLDGNLANGGFAVALLGSYSRLLGDAARSPIVSIRGSRNQFVGGVLLGYTF